MFATADVLTCGPEHGGGVDVVCPGVWGRARGSGGGHLDAPRLLLAPGALVPCRATHGDGGGSSQSSGVVVGACCGQTLSLQVVMQHILCHIPLKVAIIQSSKSVYLPCSSTAMQHIQRHGVHHCHLPITVSVGVMGAVGVRVGVATAPES